MPLDILYEIGVEEIPAGTVLPALEQLAAGLTAGLADLRLTHGEIQTYGTPRRTVLLSGSGGATMAASTAAQPLEVPDGPCRVMLSSTGLLARLDGTETPGSGGPRVAHDVVVSTYGRGLWLLRDITTLEQADQVRADAPVVLYAPRPGVRVRVS